MEPIKTQDPKYNIVDGKLVNSVTGVAIPDDEPVFILRAKDNYSVNTLQHYSYNCEYDSTFRNSIDNRINDFVQYRRNNKDFCKNPD